MQCNERHAAAIYIQLRGFIFLLCQSEHVRPEEQDGITMSPVGGRRGAVFRTLLSSKVERGHGSGCGLYIDFYIFLFFEFVILKIFQNDY